MLSLYVFGPGEGALSQTAVNGRRGVENLGAEKSGTILRRLADAPSANPQSDRLLAARGQQEILETLRDFECFRRPRREVKRASVSD